MSRSKLFQIRFAATASLLLLAFALLRLVWFPGGYFAISGIGKLFLVLVAVNFVIGPSLSAMLFKPGKRGLKFDLVVIACIEIAVLGWGMHEILERRPAFAVFAVDRFEAVTVAEVDLTQLKYGNLAPRAGIGPRLVYAEMPTDVDVMNLLIDETVFLGMNDIDRRPEFWKPYAQGMQVLKAAATPLATLLSTGDSRAGAIQSWLQEHESHADDFIFLPIQGWSLDGVMIFQADTGYPVDLLPIDPWPESDSAQ
jgi:hypothetical protein